MRECVEHPAELGSNYRYRGRVEPARVVHLSIPLGRLSSFFRQFQRSLRKWETREGILAFPHTTSSLHMRITFLQDECDRSVFSLLVSSKPRHLSLQTPIDPDERVTISVQGSKSGKSPYPSLVGFQALWLTIGVRS